MTTKRGKAASTFQPCALKIVCKLKLMRDLRREIARQRAFAPEYRTQWASLNGNTYRENIKLLILLISTFLLPNCGRVNSWLINSKGNWNNWTKKNLKLESTCNRKEFNGHPAYIVISKQNLRHGDIRTAAYYAKLPSLITNSFPSCLRWLCKQRNSLVRLFHFSSRKRFRVAMTLRFSFHAF